jgi:heme/copper-type cytochrome/quinol oxidase subunit 2
METRLVIAYLLMALIFLGLSAAFLYATRDMRSLRRAQKQAARTRRQTRARNVAEQKG